MRVCHCILAGKGPKGGCCQDEEPRGTTWVSTNTHWPPPSPLGPLPNSFSSTLWTHHPRIQRIGVRERPKVWQVTDHLAGTRNFVQWKEARDYALAKVELVYEQGRCPNVGNMCNCIGACQPRRKWKAVGFS